MLNSYDSAEAQIGAWKIATALVRQLPSAEHMSCSVRVLDVFPGSDCPNSTELRTYVYALRGYLFKSTRNTDKGQVHSTIPLFACLDSIENASVIEATFNPAAHPALQELREAVSLLRHNKQLTREELPKLFQHLASDTEFLAGT